MHVAALDQKALEALDLTGKVVLVDDVRDVREPFDGYSKRLEDKELSRLADQRREDAQPSGERAAAARSENDFRVGFQKREQMLAIVQKKRPLAIAMVQLGLDVAGIVQNGGSFVADGGSGAGRKFPLLLAGALLHDDALLDLALTKKYAFAEDAQTFFVAETAPGVINGGFGGYGPEDIGLAEWGNRHATDPSLDQKAWAGDPYRRCCTANVWGGFVLAARAMKLEKAWGHDPLFDYVDRYLQVEPRGEWTRCWSRFTERMWDRHRERF